MSKTLTAVDYRRVAAIQAKIDLLETKKQKILAGVTVGNKVKAATKKGKKPVSDARAKAQQKRRANERKAAKLAAAKKTGEKAA